MRCRVAPRWRGARGHAERQQVPGTGRPHRARRTGTRAHPHHRGAARTRSRVAAGRARSRQPCTSICPGNTTVIGEGGTPSVIPLSVATYAGRPATRTFSEVEPGRVETTVVQGLVAGVGGRAQPTIGAPSRSGS